MEAEFHAFVRDDLMKRDLTPYEWEPPARKR